MSEDEKVIDTKTIVVNAFKNLKIPKKIDSEFVEKYFSKLAQARLSLKQVNLGTALLHNGFSGIDCSDIDFNNLTKEQFELIPFDSNTTFSQTTIDKFHPEEILERGKKFGLGLEELGLTGKGIHIAIIDLNCNPDLIDADIVQYTGYTDNEEEMHGTATLSLLASKSCGVAKDAKVHFFATRDALEGEIAKERESYLQHIIDYNKSCSKEDDKILVVSGSWRLSNTEFKKYSEALRMQGCELICANNFDENFNEFTGHDDNIQIPLNLTEDEKNTFLAEIRHIIDKNEKMSEQQKNEKYEKYKNRVESQLRRKDKVKIPISRTHHQMGGGYIYESSYSTSWGIPQIAGLFATFKEQNRQLTFEDFCDIATNTALGKNRVINPQGIYQVIERQKAKGKSGLDDALEDDKSNISLTKSATNMIMKEKAKEKDNIQQVKNEDARENI